MTLPMSDEEAVVLRLHPHWVTLVRPVLVLLVTAAVGGFAAAKIPSGSWQSAGRLAVLAVAVVVLVVWTVLPYLKWLTTHYVLTTQRLIIRTGIIARHGRDVPLNRINDVSFSESLIERVLRSGSLVIESAGERGQITLAQVPRVEHVQRELYRMVEAQDDREHHRRDAQVDTQATPEQ